MTRRAKSAPVPSSDRQLSVLEAELTKAAEDFRIAKLAAREAKAQAKILKKEMKRVRRVWMAAVAEQDKAISVAKREKAQTAKARAKKKIGTGLDTQRRVAESPETVRKPRSTKKRPALEPSTAKGTDDLPTAATVVAPANESRLDSEVPDA